MSQILHEVLQANGRYVETFGDKSKLALPPARGIAILTCMDARLDPAKFAGLSEGEFIDWLTIEHQAKSVAADVKRIRRHPLVPPSIPIFGYIYDVATGRLVEVPEAKPEGIAG